jgi:hypothetical protein
MDNDRRRLGRVRGALVLTVLLGSLLTACGAAQTTAAQTALTFSGQISGTATVRHTYCGTIDASGPQIIVTLSLSGQTQPLPSGYNLVIHPSDQGAPVEVNGPLGIVDGDSRADWMAKDLSGVHDLDVTKGATVDADLQPAPKPATAVESFVATAPIHVSGTVVCGPDSSTEFQGP